MTPLLLRCWAHSLLVPSRLPVCVLLLLACLPVPVAAETQAVILLPPTFSVQRGFYTAPFAVTLSTTTAGASIRYTLDGTTPSAAVGTVYTGPIPIAGTTPLRAVVYKGSDRSPVETHTYIFLNQVLQQPATPPPGWPSFFAADDGNGSYPADYEVDPDIVNHPNYRDKIAGALQSIPTVSLVTDLPYFWDPDFGIYYNSNEKDGDPGSEPDPLNTKWERPVSVEWINADGTSGFGQLGGVRIHGQASRRPKNTPKHSLRLSFKKQYGLGKLDFALFDFADPVAKFDQLVLRNGGNRIWSYYDRDQRREADYVNDEWSRRTWLQMGHLTARGTYVHLYINGIYWGLYLTTERLDEKFLQAYLGGAETDYDYIVTEEELDDIPVASAGTLDAFNELVGLLSGTEPISNARYEQIAQKMDLVDFADYLLHTHYIGKVDWPYHNWNAYRKRTGPDTRFRWMTWDDDSALNRVNQLWYMTNSPPDHPQSPSWMFLRLITNAEFRQLFADRIYKHVVALDGVLTPANCAAMYTALTAKIDQAIIGESARWGDYARDVYHQEAAPKAWPAYLHSRDLLPTDPVNHTGASGDYPDSSKKSWLQVRSEKLDNYCPNRGANLLNQYVDGTIRVSDALTLHIPLYQTTLIPPSYAQLGGAVPANYSLTITNPNSGGTGDLYYTLDGSDPRALGGGIGATAIAGGDAVQTSITQVTNVKARIRVSDSNWSPLMDYLFYPPQPLENLVINEIHYNPLTPVGVDGDDYEFIELYNKGTTPLRLDNAQFVRGISYKFPYQTTINPGQYLVLAADPATFRTRYPGVTVFGDFRGNLSNNGEGLEVRDALVDFNGNGGTVIDLVDFDDGQQVQPWPLLADGAGPSLELNDPALDNALAAHWHASVATHGTPGAANSAPPLVSITSPKSGDVLRQGTAVEIAATASDQNGTVTQVAFFANGVAIAGCVDTSAPYTCRWTPATVGSYSLTAKATDNDSAVTISAAVTVTVSDPNNQPPTISIIRPATGENFFVGEIVGIKVDARDADGSVAKVAFYANGVAIADCVDTVAPYECNWTPTAAGTVSLTAQATDTGGSATPASAVVVTVNPPGNEPPAVEITSPANGANLVVGTQVTIVATASDSNGTVANVEFFANGEPIAGCADATAPYECSWTPNGVGPYNLTVQAVDNAGATAGSSIVAVIANTVNNPPPVITIISPAAGETVQVGEPLVITVDATVNASYGNGSSAAIVQVAFFANNVPIPGCVDQVSPFQCTWTPAVAGEYSLTALATDDLGSIGIALAVQVTATGEGGNRQPALFLPLVRNQP